jgi:hypothetical protein
LSGGRAFFGKGKVYSNGRFIDPLSFIKNIIRRCGWMGCPSVMENGLFIKVSKLSVAQEKSKRGVF